MKIQVKNAEKIVIKEAEDIYDIMRLIFKREQLIDRTKEHFWTVALNTAQKILNIELVGMGSRHAVLVDPVEVFSVPLQKKASCIILIHNHPSGSLQPSEEDIDITNRLIQVGFIQRMPVEDHIIITNHSFFSFQANGLIEKLRMSSKYAPSFIYEKTMEKKFLEMKILGEKREKMREKNGLKVGKKRGREEGEKAGIEKGITEKAREIAKQMLLKDMDKNLIKDITGLSLQWIGRLQNELKKKK